MCCNRREIGLIAAAFGLGLLLASLIPSCVLLPVASVALIAGGVILYLC